MYIKFTIKQLVRLNSWCGVLKKYSHYYANSNNVLGIRQKACVIDVAPSLYGIRDAINIIKNISMTRGYIFFASQVPHHADFLKYIAYHLYQPYSIRAWTAGLISNHRFLIKMQEKFKDFIYDEEEFAYVFKYWISKQLYNMLKNSWLAPFPPEFTFIADSNLGSGAVRESNLLRIPTYAIVDTDSSASYLDYPVYGNSFGLKPIFTHLSVVARASLLGYIYYIRNFVSIRNILRSLKSRWGILRFRKRLYRKNLKALLEYFKEDFSTLNKKYLPILVNYLKKGSDLLAIETKKKLRIIRKMKRRARKMKRFLFYLEEKRKFWKWRNYHIRSFIKMGLRKKRPFYKLSLLKNRMVFLSRFIKYLSIRRFNKAKFLNIKEKAEVLRLLKLVNETENSKYYLNYNNYLRIDDCINFSFLKKKLDKKLLSKKLKKKYFRSNYYGYFRKPGVKVKKPGSRKYGFGRRIPKIRFLSGETRF